MPVNNEESVWSVAGNFCKCDVTVAMHRWRNRGVAGGAWAHPLFLAEGGGGLAPNFFFVENRIIVRWKKSSVATALRCLGLAMAGPPPHFKLCSSTYVAMSYILILSEKSQWCNKGSFWQCFFFFCISKVSLCQVIEVIGSHCESKSLPPSPHLKMRKCKFWLCHWDSQSYNDTKVLWCPNGPPHPKHMLSGHIQWVPELWNWLFQLICSKRVG